MRVFSSSRGRRRFRRATDVFLLVPGVLLFVAAPLVNKLMHGVK